MKAKTRIKLTRNLERIKECGVMKKDPWMIKNFLEHRHTMPEMVEVHLPPIKREEYTALRKGNLACQGTYYWEITKEQLVAMNAIQQGQRVWLCEHQVEVD